MIQNLQRLGVFLTLLVALSVTPNLVNAQSELIIGNGTSSSTSWGPIYRSSAGSSFDFSRYSYLYTASDLAGLPVGSTVLGISWDKASTSGIASSADDSAFFKVYLDTTSATSLTAGANWNSIISGALTVVDTAFDSTNNLSNSGWIDFYFNTPVPYGGNGVQLSADWDISSISGSPTSGSFTWRFEGGHSGKNIYDNGSSSDTILGSSSSNRPNIRILYTPPAVNNIAVTQVISADPSCSLDTNESVTIILQNQGSINQTGFNVGYTVNGGSAVSEVYTDTLFGGQTDTFTFSTNANLGTTGVYNIVAYSALVGDIFTGNDTSAFMTEMIPTISSYPYTQSWETGNAGWFAAGTNNTWELGMPTDDMIDTAFDGTQAWVTDLDEDYITNHNGYLQSPCFNIASLNIPEISFAAWWEAEFSWDGANLQFSDDGGATWNLLGAIGTGDNWYNDATISGLNSLGAASGTGWTGRNGSGSNDWLIAKNELDTTGLDSIIIFRYYFGSDGSGQDDGFGLDAFTFQEKPPFDASITAINNVDFECGADSAEFDIVISNLGTVAIDNIPVHTSLNAGSFALAFTYADTLLPTESDTVTISIAVSPGLNDLVATTVFPGESVSANDTASSQFNSSPLVSSFPYTESWESGAADWFSGGATSVWELGAPSDDEIDTAFAGTQAWVTDLDADYATNEDAFIQSPCFDLSSLTTPEISFGAWWEAEFSWDGANLQYSDDGGATWNLLGDVGTGDNWYTDNTIFGLSGVGEGSQIGWTGRNGSGSNGWLVAKNTVDTTGLNDVVIFRYYFGSDGSGQDDGFAVDSFALYEQPLVDDAGIASLISTALCNDTIEVIITNFGTTVLDTIDYSYAINGGSTMSGAYVGSLNPSESDTISIATGISVGTSSIEISTDLSSDVDTTNDGVSANLYYGDFPVLVNITTGNFAGEVNWYLFDQNSDTIAFADPGSYANFTTYFQEVCLVSTDTFTFEAWDDYGDGWNGGFYHVSFCDTNGILANNDSLDPSNGTVPFNNELEVSETFTLPQAPLTYSSAVTDILCFGANTGLVDISAAGGLMPYHVDWSNNDSTLLIDSLTAGDYILNISDSTGCWSFTDTFSVSQPDAFVSSIDIMNTTCPEGMDGMLVVSADSGGVAPFTYLWNDANATANDSLNNIMTGTYTVVITDSNNCTYLDSATVVADNASPSVSIVGADSICGGDISTLDAGAGFATYAWTGGGSNQTLDVGTTGSYEVTITDTNGCINTDSFSVFAFPMLMVSANGTNANCEGGNDGSVVAMASGGDTTSYSYMWNTGENTGMVAGLEADTFTVTVTDAFGCEEEATVAITFDHENPEFTFDPESVQAIDSITVSAGSFDAYEWSTGETTMSILVTSSGTYTVTVTDANGCSTSDDISVEIWPLGVDQVEATSVEVFPNPSTGIFNIAMGNVPANSVEFTVMNVNGQIISTKTTTANAGDVADSIDLSNAASGVYFLQINIDGNISALRLSVQ